MTRFAVGKVEIDSRLADIATIPVFGLVFSVKFSTAPVFKTRVGYLLRVQCCATGDEHDDHCQQHRVKFLHNYVIY